MYHAIHTVLKCSWKFKYKAFSLQNMSYTLWSIIRM